MISIAQRDPTTAPTIALLLPDGPEETAAQIIQNLECIIHSVINTGIEQNMDSLFTLNLACSDII